MGMTLDPFQTLVLALGNKGVWYSSTGKIMGSISAPTGALWSTVAANSDSDVYFGDTVGANHLISAYSVSGGPPKTGAAPICTPWSANSAVADQFETGVYDSFKLAAWSSNIYYASDSEKSYIVPNSMPNSVVSGAYGTIAMTHPCGQTLTGRLRSPYSVSYPPIQGNDLTEISGIAVDPNSGNVAVTVLPNYTTQAQALTLSPWVYVWAPITANDVSIPNAAGTVPAYGPGPATGFGFGQPSYGP
jgi:hypothetical protein